MGLAQVMEERRHREAVEAQQRKERAYELKKKQERQAKALEHPSISNHKIKKLEPTENKAYSFRELERSWGGPDSKYTRADLADYFVNNMEEIPKGSEAAGTLFLNMAGCELFVRLDLTQCGKLYQDEMYIFAQLAGFKGTIHDWDKWLNEFCQARGKNPADGIEPDMLAKIIDSWTFADIEDDNMWVIVKQLPAKYGVPQKKPGSFYDVADLSTTAEEAAAVKAARKKGDLCEDGKAPGAAAAGAAAAADSWGAAGDAWSAGDAGWGASTGWGGGW